MGLMSRSPRRRPKPHMIPATPVTAMPQTAPVHATEAGRSRDALSANARQFVIDDGNEFMTIPVASINFRIPPTYAPTHGAATRRVGPTATPTAVAIPARIRHRPARKPEGHGRGGVMIQSIRELENSKVKLRTLEEEYEAARKEPADDEEVREAELQSLKELINQFKEEIARYEAHIGTRVEPE